LKVGSPGLRGILGALELDVDADSLRLVLGVLAADSQAHILQRSADGCVRTRR
jgi:hypothetical protein